MLSQSLSLYKLQHRLPLEKPLQPLHSVCRCASLSHTGAHALSLSLPASNWRGKQPDAVAHRNHNDW
jgi:hypothetical protein